MIKKTSGSGIKIKYMSDQRLAEKLHKPIITRLKNKQNTSFIDNTPVADLTDMQLIKEFVFYYIIDNFSQYLRVISLKHKIRCYNY